MHDIGVANNAIMQKKLDIQQAQMESLTPNLVAQSALATKYHAVIDTAMSMERTKETDDTTIITQMTAFTAQQDQQMATMRR